MHEVPDGALQEGIYYAPGCRPGKFFGLLFLRVARDCDASRVGVRLADLWQLYQGLKAGRVPDLEPATVPFEDDNTTVLIGLGPNAFKLNGAKHPAPGGLNKNHLFASPRPSGGGQLLAGSGLEYAADVRVNFATEEICIQVIADTKLAVDRTIVETWKRLSDSADRDTGIADLEPTTFYLGFQRSDHRSWIDFHDGLSNMRSEDREAAITIDEGKEQPWCAGGTYLAFLRLAVDLPSWRRLERRAQELLVGRDKLSGCPIVSVGCDGAPRTDPGCPSQAPRSGRPPTTSRSPSRPRRATPRWRPATCSAQTTTSPPTTPAVGASSGAATSSSNGRRGRPASAWA